MARRTQSATSPSCETLDEIGAIPLSHGKNNGRVGRKQRFGFSPKSAAGFDKWILAEDNSTLFVFGKDADRFAKCQIMFPVLSRA